MPNNSLYVEFFKACGATCTPMNFSEVYNALQLKTLDGQENPIDVPYSNKFYEVQKYISQTDHMADAWLVGFNTAKFDKLTDEQKNAITKAGEEVREWNVEFMEKKIRPLFRHCLTTVWNIMKFLPRTASCLSTFPRALSCIQRAD